MRVGVKAARAVAKVETDRREALFFATKKDVISIAHAGSAGPRRFGASVDMQLANPRGERRRDGCRRSEHIEDYNG
jgi:hypothetical protein